MSANELGTDPHQLALAAEPVGWFAAFDPLGPGSPRTRLLGVVALILLSALPLVLLAPMLEAPFEPDEGVYATIARGWQDGLVPYRDLWDNKAPLLFLWYMASFSWLGDSVFAPRLMAGLAAGLTVPFVWATGRTLFGQRTGLLAAALFALSFINIYIQVTANAEVFMLLPMVAGLWAFSLGAKSGHPAWFLLAGVLTALAVFTKQTAMWAFVGYGVWMAVLFWREASERRALLEAGALMGAGAVLAATPFIVYFATHDALSHLWFALVEFNWLWAGREPFYMKLVPPLVNPAPLFGGLVFWALAAVGIWRLGVRGDRFAWLALAFLAFSEVAAQSTGLLYAHYSVQLMPGAALAAAIGLPYVLERWGERDRVLGAGIATTALITLVAAAFIYAQPTSAERFEVQYGMQDTMEDALVAPAIADAVASMTEPGDHVYEWGRESEIYFLADRQPASRHLYNRIYAFDPAMLDEVMVDLEETRPAVIYLTHEEEDFVEEVPEKLTSYLDTHYEYAGRVENADLYQRIED